MDIFAKKFLWLGASNGNIRKSQIMVKDKTETCQKQEMHFLCASDCVDMYDVMIFVGKTVYFYCNHYCDA